MNSSAVVGRLAHFHSSKGGQISFLMVFGAVAFVSLLGLVVTGGHQTSLKVEAQNAADAAALSGGAWVARGLNVISAFQVIETQLAGAAILINALDQMIPITDRYLSALRIGYTACSFLPVCAALLKITTLQQSFWKFFRPLVRNVLAKLAKCPNGAVWWLIRSLAILREAVRIGFPAVAALAAYDVARLNRSKFGLLIPGKVVNAQLSLESLTLPVQKGEISHHCDAMVKGSPEERERGYTPILGYDVGIGPMTLGRKRIRGVLWFTTGVPVPLGALIFPRIVDQQYDMLCEGETWKPLSLEVNSRLETKADCNRKGGRSTWTTMVVGTHPVSPPPEDSAAYFDRLVPRFSADDDSDDLRRKMQALRDHPDVAYVSEPNYELSETDTVSTRKPCNWTPEDSVKKSAATFWVIEETTGAGEGDAASYELTIWTRTGYEDRSTELQESNPLCEEGTNCGKCPMPRPMLLDPSDDGLSYLVLAWKPNRKLFFQGRTIDEPPGLLTYAQVEVYNGIHDDTYTQDWRVRLVPADLVGRPLDKVAELTKNYSFQTDQFPESPTFGEAGFLWQSLDLQKHLYEVNHH